jgi:hypothetical protein
MTTKRADWLADTCARDLHRRRCGGVYDGLAGRAMSFATAGTIVAVFDSLRANETEATERISDRLTLRLA